MDDELSDTLDLIMARLDAKPPFTWSLAEARRALAAIPGPGSGGTTEPVAYRIGCFSSPRLKRRLGA